MTQPTIFVVADPHLLATAVGHALLASGRYGVVVSDPCSEDQPPDRPYDAVVTTRIGPHPWSPVVVRVPEADEQAVDVTIDGVTVSMGVDRDRPFEGLVEILDGLLVEDRGPGMDAARTD